MKTKVLRRQCTYNFVLMRDDGNVRSICLKRRMLNFLIILFVLFVLIGASGLTLTYYYFGIIQDYSSIKQELAATKAQLQQFTNYESLAKVAGVPPSPVERNNPVILSSNTELVTTSNSTVVSETKNEPISNATNNLEKKVTETIANSTNTKLAANEKSFPPIESTESPLRINNIVVQNTLYMGIRIKYELVAAPQDQMVRGNVSYAAKLKNGKIIPLSTKSSEDAYFSLYRMKIFDFSVNLPQEISTKQIESIIITLNIDNGKKFQGSFLVTQ